MKASLSPRTTTVKGKTSAARRDHEPPRLASTLWKAASMLPVLLAPLLAVAADRTPQDSEATSRCLARVRDVHGEAGPWAVAGYRIGARALQELNQPRHSFALRVIHRCPAQVQFSCMADGLQAATGASPGKLNLRVEEVPEDRLSTIVEDRTTGRRLTFTLQPEFARSIRDVPRERLEAEGRRVAGLADDEIFRMTDIAPRPASPTDH
jgi:formylmethanofuran dehydrogenase subunit E